MNGHERASQTVAPRRVKVNGVQVWQYQLGTATCYTLTKDAADTAIRRYVTRRREQGLAPGSRVNLRRGMRPAGEQ